MTTVYTKPNCPACTMTIRHLEKRGITYVTASIDDIYHAAQARGITSAPVVQVDGAEMWGGYRPDRIDGLVA